MDVTKVSFLCKVASSLPREDTNQHLTLLKSYYLMRCQEINKGHGLPEKQFSYKVRCSKCCSAWKKGTEVRVRSIKSSKKQRQRLRSMKKNKDYVKSHKDLMHSNQMEQVCLFCKNSTVSFVPKPKRIKNEPHNEVDKNVKVATNQTSLKRKVDKNVKVATNQTSLKKKGSTEAPKITNKIDKGATNKVNSKKTKPRNVKPDNKSEINVYSEARDVFSLKHKNNTIASAVKEPPKIIKNSKKKKDKFAGLCQKAVLASVKLKEEKGPQHKLSLFLKPSSG